MAATNQTPGSLSLAATSPGMVKRLSFGQYFSMANDSLVNRQTCRAYLQQWNMQSYRGGIVKM